MIAMMLFQNNAFGQLKEEKWYAEMEAKGKYGVDSVFCMKELSIFTQYVNNKNYKDAYDSWTILFNNYPMCSQNIYSHGVNIVKYQLSQCKTYTAQQPWIDTLMLVYDRRIRFFGAKSKNYPEGYILGRKGVDMLKFRPELIEDSYNTLNKSIELQGEKSESPVIVCAMKATMDMENANKISRDVVTNNYQKYIKLLNANKTEPSDKVETAIEAVNNIYNIYNGKVNPLSNYTASTNNTTSSSTYTSNNTSSNVTSNKPVTQNNPNRTYYKNSKGRPTLSARYTYETQSSPYRIWNVEAKKGIQEKDLRLEAAKQGLVVFNVKNSNNIQYDCAYIDELIYNTDDVNYLDKMWAQYYRFSRLRSDVPKYNIADAYLWGLKRATGFPSIKTWADKCVSCVGSNNGYFFASDEIKNKIFSLINSANNINEKIKYYDYFYDLCQKHYNYDHLEFLSSYWPDIWNERKNLSMWNEMAKEINETRSFDKIDYYNQLLKKWGSNFIYKLTEEVQLYKKICVPQESDLRYQDRNVDNIFTYLNMYNRGLRYDIPFFENCKTYIEKYSNSGYNIEEHILTRLQNMEIRYQAKASIDFLELTSYLADKPTLEEKIKNMMISVLKQLSEEQRLDLSLYALQSKISDKNKNNLKTQLKLMETGYTTIKTKSSATRYWVDIIDQYLTCFPTSTHKTELNTLKPKYVAECNAAELRRQEEEHRSQGQQKNVNAENYKGKYVTVVVRDSESSCNFPYSTHYYNITIYGRCSSYYNDYKLYLDKYDMKIISIQEARGESTDNCVYNKIYNEWKEKNEIYTNEIISISVQ